MDIFNLKKSGLRREILKLYFSRPEKKYYLRQLEKILKKPVSYIRREMIKLAETGLFISEYIGKERFFYLNPGFSLYREMEKIVSATIGLEAGLKEELKKIVGIEAAFIFGSFAGGSKDQLSDIDLMIIGAPEEDKIIDTISRIESGIDREINYHIFSPADWEDKLRKKNSFIKSVLKNPKIFLIGDEKDFSKFN